MTDSTERGADSGRNEVQGRDFPRVVAKLRQKSGGRGRGKSLHFALNDSLSCIG